MKTMNKVTMIIGMLAFAAAGIFGCSGAGDATTAKQEIKNLAKADDTTDYCKIYGWYGDEICDTFCLNPDPDCICNSDTDCESGAEWCEEGYCIECDNFGLECDLYCPNGFVERNGCVPCECKTEETECETLLGGTCQLFTEACPENTIPSEGYGCPGGRSAMCCLPEETECETLGGTCQLFTEACPDNTIPSEGYGCPGGRSAMCCLPEEPPVEGCVGDSGCPAGAEWCENGECVQCDNSGLYCDLYCPNGFVVRNGCYPCECADEPIPEICTDDSQCRAGAEWCEGGQCVECDNLGLACDLYCPYGFKTRNGCVPCECEEGPAPCSDHSDCPGAYESCIDGVCVAQAPPCTPTVSTDDPLYNRFEGIGLDNTCETALDCVVSGCSGEVCAAEGVATTCEALFNTPSGSCGCLDGVCQWMICAE
jgi:eight-cysteine-cluster-containing protein